MKLEFTPKISKIAFIFFIILYGWIIFEKSGVGLPYLYHWDEPLVSTAALNMLKRGDLHPQHSEICYGGVMRNTIYALDWFYYQYLKFIGEVNSLDDIKTSIGGEFRTISHPQFILIGRYLLGLYTLACFLMTYLIARIFTNNFILALFASILLGSSHQYFEHTTYATVDVPMVVWFLTSSYFALLYHQTEKIKFLYLSVWGASMAVSTKLSGAIAFLNPFLLFLLHYKKLLDLKNLVTYKIIAFCTIISIVNFLFWNPNLLTDTQNYIHWTKWVIQGYRAGGGDLSKEPGWEHLSFQLGIARNDLGNFIFFIVITAIVSFLILLLLTFIKKKEAINNLKLYAILLLPFLFYLFYLSQQRVAYHRNFLLLYPFFSILFVATLYFVNTLLERFEKTWLKLFYSIAILLFFLYIYPQYQRFYQIADGAAVVQDTRTQAIEKLKNLISNQFQEKAIIGIAKELQFSEYDLKRLPYKWQYFSHTLIDSAYQANSILVTTRFFNLNPSSKIKADSLNKYTQKYKVIDSIAGNPMFCDEAPVLRQTPHINPTIFIIEGTPYNNLPDFSFEIFSSNTFVSVPSSDKVTLLYKKMNSGRYMLKIKANGSLINGEGVDLRIWLNGRAIADFCNTKQDEIFQVPFELKEQKHVHIEICITNDLYMPEKGIDRNGYVTFTGIYEGKK
ncbi:MAG: phospholipid carrier-dependent glycosyltransferase [Candidatus Calescibacterium sp.]|nr:phospholipid carrier-dependent glycosyltransferase [Candidatus Calescibacterium sp.]